MCLALYVASPKPLPLVPWNPDYPAFHVVDLPERAAGARRHLQLEHVYYVGTQQGCSCAFNYEHEYRAILQLTAYLHTVLHGLDQIEAFVSQPGHEEEPVQHSLIISPEGIALPDFFFKEGQFLRICSAKSLRALRETEVRRLRKATQQAAGLKPLRGELHSTLKDQCSR